MATKDLPSWKKKRLKGDKGLAETPDAFQSNAARLIDKIVPHLKLIALGLVALGIVLGGYYTWSYLKVKKQSRATAAFGHALDLQGAEIKAEDKDTKPDDKSHGKKPEEPDTDPDALPTYKSQDDRATAVLAALDTVNKDYGGTSAASRADLLRGATLFKLGKLPEAEQALKTFLSKTGHSDPLRFVATEDLGYVLEAKGDLDGALARFGELDPDPTKTGSGFGEERALYHQARIYSEKKDAKKAAELLHKLVSQFPTSPLRKDAEDRLALLEPG